MEIVLLGLAVAALWGSGDTLAAKVSQRIGSPATTLMAQVAGLLLAGLVALLVGIPTNLPLSVFMQSLLAGLLLGAIAALAYLTLYKALEQGPLAVASPLVSAQGGVTWLSAIIVLHELPDIWQLAFLLITFVGVMLAAVNGSEVRRLVRARTAHLLLRPGIVLALVSLLSFGILAFGLGEASRESNWLWCVVWTRLFSCLLLTICLCLDTQATGKQEGHTKDSGQHQDWQGWLAGTGAVVVGCADVGGLLLLSLASTLGSIGIVGMVASAYGVIPLVAGILLFKERPAGNQIVGVVLLIAGLVGVANPSPALDWRLLGGLGVLLIGAGLARLAHRLLRVQARRATSTQWSALSQKMRTLPAMRQAEVLSLMQEMVTGLQTLSAANMPPVVVFCGSPRLAASDPVYQAAYETAQLLAEAGCSIMLGGETGIMEAATCGAGMGGMLSIGCLLDAGQAEGGTRANESSGEEEGAWHGTQEQATERCDAPDVSLRFSHELARQSVMRACAQAFVIFPGGLETLNDLCQTLHAIRTGACPRVPMVLYDRAAWSVLLEWLWMDERREAEATFDGRERFPSFFLCDEPAEIAACLLADLFPDRCWPPLAGTAGNMSK